MSAVLAALRRANARTARLYPGEPAGRQPVHVMYGGAHLFKADVVRKIGQAAAKALQQYAPDAASFAAAFGMPQSLARLVRPRVQAKLAREPVEDIRIDFEDGFGPRPAAEEDQHAVRAAEELAQGFKEGTLPPFVGIRIKSLSTELCARSLRTLELFVSTVARRTQRLPDGFVVTLPKILNAEQPRVLDAVLTALERRLRLPRGAIKIEIMIETTQSVQDPLGLAGACGGRCVAAHFGTYDYTAACQISAADQRMDHPACDHAKHAMQVALAGTGVRLCDGATNIMPVPVHRPAAGTPLASEQVHENVLAVHRAWRLQYDHVRRSLSGGFYQGWDLHPAQLPARYAAVYAFFLEGLPAVTARLRSFVDKAAQATLAGGVFDDAATGQGLLNHLLRGLSCGAVTESEAAAAGLTYDELQTRSFLNILEGRRRRKRR